MCPADTFPLEVLLIRLDPEVPVPRYYHADDAGADLVTTRNPMLPPGERAVVGTGSVSTIDAGYRGGLQVCLVNHDLRKPVVLRRMDRVVQRVERAAFREVSALPDSPPRHGRLRLNWDHPAGRVLNSVRTSHQGPSRGPRQDTSAASRPALFR